MSGAPEPWFASRGALRGSPAAEGPPAAAGGRVGGWLSRGAWRKGLEQVAKVGLGLFCHGSPGVTLFAEVRVLAAECRGFDAQRFQLYAAVVRRRCCRWRVGETLAAKLQGVGAVNPRRSAGILLRGDAAVRGPSPHSAFGDPHETCGGSE